MALLDTYGDGTVNAPHVAIPLEIALGASAPAAEYELRPRALLAAMGAGLALWGAIAGLVLMATLLF